MQITKNIVPVAILGDSRHESFQKVERVLQGLREYTESDIVVTLVGNKTDLKHLRYRPVFQMITPSCLQKIRYLYMSEHFLGLYPQRMPRLLLRSTDCHLLRPLPWTQQTWRMHFIRYGHFPLNSSVSLIRNC